MSVSVVQIMKGSGRLGMSICGPKGGEDTRQGIFVTKVNEARDVQLRSATPAFELVHTMQCVWYGMVWYGMVWYGMVWYGMVWYGMVW